MIKSHLYAIQFTRYSVVSLGLAELLYSTMLSSVCQVLFSNSFEFVLFLVKLHRFARYFVGHSLERSDILPRPLPFVKHEFYFFSSFSLRLDIILLSTIIYIGSLHRLSPRFPFSTTLFSYNFLSFRIF